MTILMLTILQFISAFFLKQNIRIQFCTVSYTINAEFWSALQPVAAPRLEPPPLRRGGFAPRREFRHFCRGVTWVYARQMFLCKVRRLLSLQIPKRCEVTGLLTKHPWMVVYFSSPQQQQQRHTHGCQISTLLYTIINEALVPIK